VYNKAYGKSLVVSQLPEGIRQFFPIPVTPGPLEPMCVIVKSILEDVKELRSVIESLEMRLRGSSLLIVYEGDEKRLKEVLEKERREASENEPGEALEEEEEEDEDDEESAERFYDVRLIDFAHCRGLLEGESGPDEGILKGLDTLMSLLQGWVDEVEDKMNQCPEDD
jgi:inositol-polyphosphate multikinase